MTMVLIPQWVIQACERHGKNLAQVFDNREQLLSILSTRDVDFYYDINTIDTATTLFGEEVGATFRFIGPYPADGPVTVKTGNPDLDPEEIFFAEHLQSDPEKDGTVDVDYTVKMLTCDVCYVSATRQRRDADVPSEAGAKRQFYSRALSILFARGGGQYIARTPLFRLWIRHLLPN